MTAVFHFGNPSTTAHTSAGIEIMRGLGLACISLIVFTASGCGVGYYVEVECTLCKETNPVEGFGCSEEEAEQAAKTNCENLNGEPGDQLSVRTEVGPYCRAGNAPVTLEPIPETARFFKKSYDTAQRVIASAQAGEVEACPAKKVTFTVIARNQNEDDQVPCDDARAVRVVYEKYIAETGGSEEVTLSAVIPFGDSHTFTCTDAYASEDGSASYFYVIYQLYNFVPNEVCEPVPFEEGGMSRGFSNELKQGGTLDITYLPVGSGNTFAYTITNPGSRAMTGTKAAGVTDLQPIPDPMFTVRQP